MRVGKISGGDLRLQKLRNRLTLLNQQDSVVPMRSLPQMNLTGRSSSRSPSSTHAQGDPFGRVIFGRVIAPVAGREASAQVVVHFSASLFLLAGSQELSGVKEIHHSDSIGTGLNLFAAKYRITFRIPVCSPRVFL